jgi:hypothetical protein
VSLFDRSIKPSRYAVTFYETNESDVGDPLFVIGTADIETDDEIAAVIRARRIAADMFSKADSWELFERKGLHWDPFDDVTGCWEWESRNVLDSWQDPEAFRVSLICGCQQDVAYGYGSSLDEARRVAENVFVEAHGKRTPYTQVINEKAVEHARSGAHYELVSAAVRWIFTPGVGEALDTQAVTLGAGDWWANAMTFIGKDKPYIFECSDAAHTTRMLEYLGYVAGGLYNAKLKQAAQRALEQLRPIIKAVHG